MTDFPQVRTKMTSQEFLTEQPESNLPIELIDGEIIVSPTPKNPHQHTVGKAFLLLNEIAANGKIVLSPMDVVLDDENTVQPDVFWVSGENSLCKLGDDGYWYGAPDLVIEVLSPSTARKDRSKKFRLYQKHGTREYWLVETDAQTVEVYQREDEKFKRIDVFGRGDTFTSPVLGGATIAVDKLFV